MTRRPSPTTAAAPLSIRQRTTHGVMWLAAQAAAGRVVTVLQQLALAWLLQKSDFGLIGLAYTATSFVGLLSNPGVDAVLVQRQRHFRHWANPAFWLGMSLGLCGMIVMLLLAPAAAWIYGQPALVGLTAVLALAAPIQSLQMVALASLQANMRFRATAFLSLMSSVLMAILTVGCAYLGLGAYSFVIPVPIVGAAMGGAAWWLVRPPVRWQLDVGRWKYLFGNSAAMGGTRMLNTVSNQGDYVALGLAGVSEAAIGSYVFAFSVAIQALRLLLSNVPTVLFPTLSRLVLQPETQVRATRRATRLLALVVAPFCIWQVIATAPFFRVVLPPRWLDAVVPCQILTLGLMFNACCWPATSLMMAQGRFRELFRVSLIGTLAFVAFVAGAIWLHRDIVSVAVAVATWHFFNSQYLYWSAIPRSTPAYGYFLETYRPLLAVSIAAVPCLLLYHSLPTGFLADLMRLIGSTFLLAAVYLLVLLRLAPKDSKDLWDQLAPVFSRFRRSREAGRVEVQ